MTEKAVKVEDKSVFGEAVPAKTMMLACLLAYLLPGAGHLLLGKRVRGVIFTAGIFAMFALGLAMKGHLFFPNREDSLSIFPSFANAGIGLAYFICLLIGVGFGAPQASAPTFEYGNTFLWTAGLLNILVIMDAYDIAIGRKK